MPKISRDKQRKRGADLSKVPKIEDPNDRKSKADAVNNGFKNVSKIDLPLTGINVVQSPQTTQENNANDEAQQPNEEGGQDIVAQQANEEEEENTNVVQPNTQQTNPPQTGSRENESKDINPFGRMDNLR